MDDKAYLEYLVGLDETDSLEFKASLRTNDEGNHSNDLTKVVVKAITSFANTRGGKILIGFHEKKGHQNRSDGFLGIQRDGWLETNDIRPDIDKWTRHLETFVEKHCSYKGIFNLVNIEFLDYAENITCALINVEKTKSRRLVGYLDNNGIEEHYARKSKGNYRLKNETEKDEQIESREGNMPRGWSINSSMLYLDKTILEGNWQGNQVVDINELNNWPDEKGLYIFYASTKGKEEKLFGSFRTVLYVGKSVDSVRRRARSHLKPHEKNYKFFRSCINSYRSKFMATYLLLPELSDKKIRFLESQIIDYFSPPLNNKRESELEERTLPAIPARAAEDIERFFTGDTQ